MSHHRVLFIPELLDIVFGFLNSDDNAKNARVCKRWSDVALDVVWKDVDDLVRLFRLLKPIEDDAAFGYCFTSLPQASDWARFERVASRVRSLRLRPPCDDVDVCALLDDVARTRTSLAILPNMHTLEWLYTSPAHVERCNLFLHPRLRHLSVIAPSQIESRPDFYTDLCARAPNLHSLALFVRFPGKPLDQELRVLVEHLPELRKIVLPEFHYTSAVVTELSRASNLAVVDFSQDLRLGHGDPSNVASFSPHLAEDAFPSLRELNLSVRIDHLDRFFFRSSFAPTRLAVLYVNSYALHTPDHLHALLVTLSDRCPLLSKLNVQLYHKSLPPSDRLTSHQLSYDTIKPVLGLSRLTSFELVHEYPLRISLDDIEDLASKWPHLEHLLLNAEPLFVDQAGFTLDLRALLPFARHCPRIRALGLYINATDADILPMDECVPPFPSLETLSVGTSHAGDTTAVATFLSRICPPRCHLEMGITWTEFGSERDRILPDNVRYVLQLRCLAWQAVDKLLPALVQLRHEERQRTRALRDEVEDLRIRTRLLMDKATTETKPKDSCLIA